MPKHTFILLLIIAITLGACQGQKPASPGTTAPAAAVQPTASLVVLFPTATEADPEAVDEGSPGCTVTSPRPTPGPTEQSVFPPATEKDWSIGPEDAAITLIEYSDFQ